LFPVCPNSTRILGIGRVLKSIRDPFLQQLIEIEAGKQDRLILVQEKLDESYRLDGIRGKLTTENGRKLTTLIFEALSKLHGYGYIHQGR